MSSQNRNLGQDMRREIVRLDMQEVRQCTRSVMDSAVGKALCFGGIFLDNVMYRPTHNGVDGENRTQLTFSLGSPKTTPDLWNQWIAEQSTNIAYIPPEEVMGTGDTSKADSWAVGCFLAHLLNYGKPLRLRRNMRNASGTEYVDTNEPDIIDRLHTFYSAIEQAQSLNIGPEIVPMVVDKDNVVKLPSACEDFLARCLELAPEERWALDRLRDHPFVDLEISLEELVAMDENENYRTLPLVYNFTVKNLRPHPFLVSTIEYTIQVGISPTIRRVHPIGTAVDVWKFHLVDEARDRELYTRAYGRLLELLTLENNDDETVRQRAGYYRIRALQLGHQNVVYHYGCQFTPRPNTYSMPEFQVFSEHCAGTEAFILDKTGHISNTSKTSYAETERQARIMTSRTSVFFIGGNFQQASAFALPLSIVNRWVGEALRGLDFLHKHGIVHRNINSGMIFFAEPSFKGTVKIGGFHYMRQLAGERTRNHEISARQAVDARFVSPEINNPDYTVNFGRKIDIWSIGCVVIHLVTGKPPLYKGLSGREIDTEMAVVYYLNRSKTGPVVPDWLPESVRSFIGRCLQFDPADRPTAAELLANETAMVVDETSIVSYRGHRAGEPLPEDAITYWTQRTALFLPKKEVLGKTCTYDYNKTDKIGSGRFGVVYRARVTVSGDYIGKKNVAVKTVSLQNGLEILAQPETWLKLVDKWRVLTTFVHDNLAAYHKVTIDSGPGGVYVEIMMDEYTGGDLAALLSTLKARNALLDRTTAVQYALDITKGVQFLHENRIIHRDLKPANILVRKLGINKHIMVIGDLDDIVQMQRSATSPTDITSLFGTYHFMSPEMLQTFVAYSRSESIGRKTDIWSLGCILLEIANRVVGNNSKLLYKNDQTVEINENMTDRDFMNFVIDGYAPLVNLVSEMIPVGFRTCITQCLLSESQRTISAAELAKILQGRSKAVLE